MEFCALVSAQAPPHPAGFSFQEQGMRFDYATRDESKVERAKETLRQTAERAGHSIVGSHVFKTDSYPALQASPSAKGVAHWIIYGFTTQAELDQVKQAEESAE